MLRIYRIEIDVISEHECMDKRTFRLFEMIAIGNPFALESRSETKASIDSVECSIVMTFGTPLGVTIATSCFESAQSMPT